MYDTSILPRVVDAAARKDRTTIPTWAKPPNVRWLDRAAKRRAAGWR